MSFAIPVRSLGDPLAGHDPPDDAVPQPTHLVLHSVTLIALSAEVLLPDFVARVSVIEHGIIGLY